MIRTASVENHLLASYAQASAVTKCMVYNAYSALPNVV